MVTIDICVPFYNGFPKICGIIDCYSSASVMLTQKKIDVGLSLQIYSDGSSFDQVNKLERYLTEGDVGNVNLVVENLNKGMDFAFEHCVRQGKSSYAWLFGQDDSFEPNLLQSLVLELINFNPDVVYINQRINDLINKKKYIKINNLSIISGFGIKSFMKSTNYNAPYFLPSLLVKREKFLDEIEKISINTSYIQMIAALELISCGRHLYFGIPIVRGLIPNDGWQNNINRRIEYACGYSNAISYFYRNKSIDKFYFKSKLEIIRQIILNKSTQVDRRFSLEIGRYNKIEYDLLLIIMEKMDKYGFLLMLSIFARLCKATYHGIKRV